MPVATMPPTHIAAELPAIPFDLRRVTPAKPCASGKGDEIVVCARVGGSARDRLPALPDAGYAARPLRAEVGLGGNVTAGVRVDRQDFGRDVSNRVLAGIKAPF